MRISNWTDADRRAKEAELVCKFCRAMNSPNRTYVLIEQDGTLVCSLCSKAWRLPKREAE